MNKVSIVSLVACALAAPSVMASHFDNVGIGKIFFNGIVSANSCRIESGDENKKVTLDSVVNNNVKKDAAVNIKRFNIKIDDCYISHGVRPVLQLAKMGVISTDGYMLNNLKGGASNAALMLMNAEGSKIDLNGPLLQIKPDRGDRSKDDDNEFTYSFKVGYIKPSELGENYVTPGKIQTQLSYTIKYI